RFLREARALLFPIDWEEPFGLVMIEAMISGTPLIAFARGAVPEILEDGVTGFICRDVQEMAHILRSPLLDRFDRFRCRRQALNRFSAQTMVRADLAVYERATREVRRGRITAPTA